MAVSLTVGMAVYDDYDGVYFTVQSIRLHHPEVADEIEFVVVDNHPSGPCAADLQALEKQAPNYRYIAYDLMQGTAVREVIFREASAPFVLCVDCHVLFVPGSLRKLLDYFHAHPETPDLLQGPLLYDDLRTLSTHMDPVWRAGMFGIWGSDPRATDPAAPPFDIELQGLGVFGCRKSAWPGFNPRLRGFGGEEGYIHEKFRRAGGRTLCLPFLRWMHRFGRPMGVPYRNTWEDRIRNYMIVADELGLDPTPALDHFRTHLGRGAADAIIASTRSEVRDPFQYFEAIYCINLASEPERWRAASARFERLGIARRVQRFEAVAKPNRHAGQALSHRAVIAQARRQGLQNVLVFEDDVRFTSDIVSALEVGLRELKMLDWDIFYLGACRWNRQVTLLPDAQRLAAAGPVTCTHAIAYHRSIYEPILAAIPESSSGVDAWVAHHHGVDQFYAFHLPAQKFLLSPVVATQTNILPMESPEVQRLVQD